MGSGEGEGCSANIEYLSVRLRIFNAFRQRPTTKEILRRPWKLIGSRLIRLTVTRKRRPEPNSKNSEKNRGKKEEREKEDEVKSWASRERGAGVGGVCR